MTDDAGRPLTGAVNRPGKRLYRPVIGSAGGPAMTGRDRSGGRRYGGTPGGEGRQSSRAGRRGVSDEPEGEVIK